MQLVGQRVGSVNVGVGTGVVVGGILLVVSNRENVGCDIVSERLGLSVVDGEGVNVYVGVIRIDRVPDCSAESDSLKEMSWLSERDSSADCDSVTVAVNWNEDDAVNVAKEECVELNDVDGDLEGEALCDISFVELSDGVDVAVKSTEYVLDSVKEMECVRVTVSFIDGDTDEDNEGASVDVRETEFVEKNVCDIDSVLVSWCEKVF